MTLAPWLEVDLGPGVRAGFSHRRGGQPRALALGDDAGRRSPQRRRAAERWAGGPVAWGRQVHGATVHVATAGGDDVAACDAMVATGDVGLAVLVADCVPVLLADPRRPAWWAPRTPDGRAWSPVWFLPPSRRCARAGAQALRAVVGTGDLRVLLRGAGRDARRRRGARSPARPRPRRGAPRRSTCPVPSAGSSSRSASGSRPRGCAPGPTSGSSRTARCSAGGPPDGWPGSSG